MALSAQNRERVLVSTMLSIDWVTASGGARNHSTTKVRPAAGKKKVVLSGETEVDNVTTTAYIDPEAHAAVLAALHAGELYAGTTVTRQFIDAAEVPIGTPLSYQGCSVAKFELSDADANGEEPAVLTVEWAVND
ncbi:MAG: hypothetical protein R2686_07135 [Candidatus Nanopelagicales bacterium]